MLSELSEVLGGGCEQEFIFCAVRSAQAEASQSDNALEMREQHLDLFALASGLFIGRRSDQGSGDVPCSFIDAARDFANRLLRTASNLQGTRRAIELAGAVKDLVVIDDRSARGQQFASRTSVDVSGLVKLEIGPGECPVIASRFVEDWYVRRNLLGSTSQCSEGAEP